MTNPVQKDSLKTLFFDDLGKSGISRKSLRYYRSDLTQIFNWLIHHVRKMGVVAITLSEVIPFIKLGTAELYKDSLIASGINRKTINRRLTTLRKFSQFLFRFHLLDFDFASGVANVTKGTASLEGTHPLLGSFHNYLKKRKVSKSTIKNYVADVRHFLSWLESNHQTLTTKH